MKAGEVPQMLVMDASDQRFGRDAFFFGTQHDRCTVGIIGANISRLVADQFLEPNPNIRLDVFDQMTEVDRPISVGQRGSN